MQAQQQSAQQQVLIAGYGYIGQALAQLLLTDGFEVHAVRRRWLADPEPGIIPHAIDLTDGRALANLPRVDYVVYAAAPNAFHDEAYRQAYVEGLAQVIACIQPRQRLILTSSTGIYGLGSGNWVDEDTPISAEGGFAARRLLESEQLLAKANFSTVALRLGGIYGPGRAVLLDSVRNGTARLMPEDAPPVWTNRIHRDDAARGIRHLLTLPAPRPVYIGVDDEPATRNDVLRFAAKLLGKQLPPIADQYAAPERGNRRCRNQRLRDSGFVFKYPSFREGFTALAQSSAR